MNTSIEKINLYHLDDEFPLISEENNKKSRVVEIISVGLFAIGILLAFSYHPDDKLIINSMAEETSSNHTVAIKPASCK